MAQTIKIELTDDLTGGPATETVTFGLDGRTYEIDLSETNAKQLRGALDKYVAKARKAGSQTRSAGSGRVTLFSQLSDDEKARFRKTTGLEKARRISDSTVQAWIDSGKE